MSVIRNLGIRFACRHGAEGVPGEMELGGTRVSGNRGLGIPRRSRLGQIGCQMYGIWTRTEFLTIRKFRVQPFHSTCQANLRGALAAARGRVVRRPLQVSLLPNKQRVSVV